MTLSILKIKDKEAAAVSSFRPFSRAVKTSKKDVAAPRLLMAHGGTRDPLLCGRLRRLGEPRRDPACFRGSGVGHLYPLAFAGDDAKLFAFLPNPERLGGRRRGAAHIDVAREFDPLVLD